MFLDKILAARAERPDSAVLESFWSQAREMPPTRGFARSLRVGDPPRIIAEFKRASPSRGVLAAELDPARQALEYERGGAVALSVLTEPHFFQGSSQDLRAARAACNLPVLRKDFLLEEWEVAEARCWGADAVLLIAAILPDHRLASMLETCQQLGIDALVEVHTREEALRVAPLTPAMVGINNRDLVTFRVDLETTTALLPLIPASSLKVAESGFETSEQLQRFEKVDAFLIGETLVRREDPATCLRQLRGLHTSAKEQ